MSGPLHSLNKKKKPYKMPSMPFRSLDFSFERELLEKLSVDEERGQFSKNRKEKSIFRNDFPSSSAEAPDNVSLNTSMMNRICKLEKQVLTYSKEVIEKDRRIKVLEEKVDLYKKHHNGESSKLNNEVKRLQEKCEVYQLQIQQMEMFLADYGMVWVGEGCCEDSKGEKDKEKTNDDVREDNEIYNKIDFDLVISNIRELNQIAGEGRHKVEKTIDGARLKVQESIPLTLYANGIFMFDGPFRDYSEATTQHWLADIVDGYFPSELQNRFPDGVPIQVTDKRNTTYQHPRHVAKFPGLGRTLGQHHHLEVTNPKQDWERGAGMDKLSKVRTLDDRQPGQKSMRDFLGKLPNSVINKDGKVVNIRGDIEKLLTGDKPASVDDGRAATGENVTTIRVKPFDGGFFDLVLPCEGRIGDLRRAIDARTSSQSPDCGLQRYAIVTNFPKQTFDDNEALLRHCGLTPRAVVLLKPV